MSKMASIAMLIGGALANALAFTGSSYFVRDYPRIAPTREKETQLGDRAASKGTGRMGTEKTITNWFH